MGRGRGILKDMLMRRGGLTGSVLRNGAAPSGNVYYVRADGTVTAPNKEDATSDASPSTSLNLGQHNSCTFAPGDTVVISDQGGVYRGTCYPPTSGTASNKINYIASGTPVFNGADLTSGWTATTGSLPTTIDEQINHNDGYFYVKGADSYKHAVKFVAPGSMTIKQIVIWARRVGTPNNSTMRVQIWDDSGGSPNAMITNGEATANVSGWSTGDFGGEHVFTFSTSPSITGSSTYYVVMDGDWTNASNNNCVAVFGLNSEGDATRRHWYYDSSWHDGGSGATLYFKLQQDTTATNVWEIGSITWNPARPVFFDGVPGRQRGSPGDCIQARDYWFDNANDKVYCYSTSDPDTAYTSPGVEIGRRDRGFNIERDHITVDGLTLKHHTAAGIRGNKNCGTGITIRNCIGEYNYDHGLDTGDQSMRVAVTGWELHSGNVWKKTSFTEKTRLVSYDGTFGTRKYSVGGLTSLGDWYIDEDGDVLYFYDTAGDPDGRTMYSYEAYFNLTVEDCIFRYNGRQGASVGYDGQNVIFQRNRCYNNGIDPITTNYDYFHQWTTGVKMFDSHDVFQDSYIRYNVCYNNGRGWARDKQGRGVGIWYDNVHSASGHQNHVYGNLVYDNKGDGIFIEITEYVDVYNNVCYDNASNTGGSTIGTIPSNICVDSRSPFQGGHVNVFGNISYGGRVGLKVTGYNMNPDGDLSYVACKNNVAVDADEYNFFADNGGDNDTFGSNNSYQYNCFGTEATGFIWWGGSALDSYGDWEIAYGESNSVESDVRFHDPANYKFWLSSLSPCIDAGTNPGAAYKNGLNESSDWPGAVTTLDQTLYGAGFEVGAYVFKHAASGGLFALDFTNTSQWDAGYFDGQYDQYGGEWSIDGGDDSHNLSALEVNDSVQMLALKQQDATGANKTYRCSDEQILAVGTKYKFRMLVDVPTADTGHQIRFLTNNSAGDYVIWKILGNGIIQCQVKTNTRINQAGLTPGNLTVMGYYTGTVFHMKAKNGHDASMSWTLWNGSDADAYGNYTETLSQLGFWIGLGISSDTAPLTHGWVKTFELMTNEYGSWAD